MTLCECLIHCISAMPKLSNDHTLVTSVTSLRLCAALKDCGTVGVKNAFDKSNAEHLFVYDDSNIGYTDWTDSEPAFSSKCLCAANPNSKTIVLLPLDHKIITGPHIIQGGVCDCLLLTEEIMCFVEFKTNMTSKNYQTIVQRANEACTQLWHTYDGIIRPRCAKLSIPLERLRSVCFHVVFDKDLEITGANSSLMDIQTQFLEERKHLLIIDNKKEFP